MPLPPPRSAMDIRLSRTTPLPVKLPPDWPLPSPKPSSWAVAAVASARVRRRARTKRQRVIAATQALGENEANAAYHGRQPSSIDRPTTFGTPHGASLEAQTPTVPDFARLLR